MESPPLKGRSPNYIPSLDGIRACAFLIVFMAHAIPGNIGTFIPATFGVTVFFFLSGYLITTLLRREREYSGVISLKDFYLRRSLRILPPMYLAYGVTFALAWLGLLSEKGNLAGLTSSLCYYYNYSQLLSTNVEVPTGMTVLWSLSIEEHFYLLFPIVYLLLTRRRTPTRTQSTILLCLCLLAPVWRIILITVIKPPIPGHVSWTYAATDARFDSLLWGCLLAIAANPVLDRPPTWLRDHSGELAAAGVIAIVASMLFRQPLYREAIRYTIQAVGLCPVFYYCIASSHKRQVSWLECKPLQWIGWLSYSLYLIHNAFLLQLHAKYPGYLVVDGVIAFGGSILYAYLIRVLIEIPLQKLRPLLRSSGPIAKRGSEIVA